MPKSKFDITEVLRMFLANKYPERRELFEEFQAYVAGSKQGQAFFSEVAAEALDKGGRPVEAMGLSFTYGMVVGVLLERNRLQQEVEEYRRTRKDSLDS